MLNVKGCGRRDEITDNGVAGSDVTMLFLQRKQRQPSGLSETNRHPGREHMSWSKVQGRSSNIELNMALLRKLSQVPSVATGGVLLMPLQQRADESTAIKAAYSDRAFPPWLALG